MEFIDDNLNMAPLMVRLSWHDAGTYDAKDNTGGPRACMRFGGGGRQLGEINHGANAGLQGAINFLQPVKDKHPNLSNADFWSLSAVCAIKCMGGPDIPWR